MQDVHVILVGSLYSRNVGYVSRVMANMGAQKLILINSKCEYDLEARQGAAGAQNHLVTATRYATWAEFFAEEPDGVRIAHCARNKADGDATTYESRIREVVQTAKTPIYLIFGPEDHGLEKADLEFAHFICELPTFGEFKSMNLSHAVMVALYILKSNAEKFVPAAAVAASADASEHEKFYFPESALREWLEALGFTLDDNRRTDVYQVLKRLFLNQQVNAKEFRVLEAVVNQTTRKLKHPSSSY